MLRKLGAIFLRKRLITSPSSLHPASRHARENACRDAGSGKGPSTRMSSGEEGGEEEEEEEEEDISDFARGSIKLEFSPCFAEPPLCLRGRLAAGRSSKSLKRLGRF